VTRQTRKMRASAILNSRQRFKRLMLISLSSVLVTSIICSVYIISNNDLQQMQGFMPLAAEHSQFQVDREDIDVAEENSADDDGDANPNPNPASREQGGEGKGSKSAASRSRRSSRPVCQDTKHLFQSPHATDNDDDDSTSTAIKAAYAELESFHNEGGNLKTIENYLNDHMDSTLDLLDITFTPKGSASGEPIPANQSITQTYKQTLIKYDKHNRGGYDQRSMPGSYDFKNSNGGNSKHPHSALRGSRRGQKKV